MRLLNGEERMFDEFYDAYKHKVYHFMLLYVKIPETAEELTIDVFVKLWHNRANLEIIENVDAFLFITCKRKALDFLRTAQKSKNIQSRIAEEIFQPAPSQDLHEKFETEDILHLALQQLPERRRIIFVLNRLQGFSYEEIANELNISIHTVRNTLAATTRQLKKFVFSVNHFSTGLLPVLYLLLFL